MVTWILNLNWIKLNSTYQVKQIFEWLVTSILWFQRPFLFYIAVNDHMKTFPFIRMVYTELTRSWKLRCNYLKRTAPMRGIHNDLLISLCEGAALFPWPKWCNLFASYFIIMHCYKCMCVFWICVTGSIAYIAFSLVVSNKAIFAQCCLHLVILVLTTISAMVSFGICVIVNL